MRARQVFGKSTALRSFIAENPNTVVRVELPHENAKPNAVLQCVLDSVRKVNGSLDRYTPSGSGVARALDHALLEWGACTRFWDSPAAGKISIAIDEAQRLSPKAIEALRYFHDGDAIGQKLGVILIGNDSFHLDGTEGFLSAPMMSRAYCREIYSYRDLSDDDLSLIIDARGEFGPEAVDLLLAYCRSRLVNRELREFGRKLDKLVDASSGAPVTAALVRTTLGFTGAN